MARGCEHFAVEVEFGKDDKATIHVPFLESGVDLRYIQELFGCKKTQRQSKLILMQNKKIF